MKSNNMRGSFVTSIPLPEFPLWAKMRNKRGPISFDLELTARCNNNCRHCYINLPAGDIKAKEKELSFQEIKEIVDEADSLGAFWCCITGGEPLLREDFSDIYLYVKKRGLLVSVFTNATLVTEEHVKLLEKYPPRDIEVTVYGVTQPTYERVTRRHGTFAAFVRGLELLLRAGVGVRLKAMALHSNLQEMSKIARFCRQRTRDYFRFDPFLHLRFDGNELRNEEIKSERLSAEEIVAIEQADSERCQALQDARDKLINPELAHYSERCQALQNARDKLINPELAQYAGNHLFHCATGIGSFSVSYDGFFQLCSSLWHRDCVYDLKKGTVAEAWQDFVPKVCDMRSNRKQFLEKCRVCPIIDLCFWCPAQAYLETGELDRPVEYFCAVARARAESVKKRFWRHRSRSRGPVSTRRPANQNKV